jgi:hypothetical protein
VSKGLSTEAGFFETTSAGSSLAVTTIAGLFQVLGEALDDNPVLELRSTVLALHHGFEAPDLWESESTDCEDFMTLGPRDFGISGLQGFGVSK